MIMLLCCLCLCSHYFLER